MSLPTEGQRLDQAEMPPEIRQAFDHIDYLLADPDTTDAQHDAAWADLERMAAEKDPEFAAALKMAWQSIRAIDN